MNSLNLSGRRRYSAHLMRKADWNAKIQRWEDSIYLKSWLVPTYPSSFDLRNISTTFQEFMHVVLSTVKWKYFLACLKNTFIFSRTPAEHIKHTGMVLGLLMNAGVAFTVKKYAIFTNKVQYLGPFMRLGRLEVAHHAAEVIHELWTPTAVTELRSS